MKKRIFFDIVNFILGVGFNIGIFALTVYLIFSYTIKSFNTGKAMMTDMTSEGPSIDIQVEIAPDASIEEVSRILEESGVIKNGFLFRVESILKGSDDAFPGGEYTLNTNMDSNQINYALRNVPVSKEDIVIVIKEGFTLKDIGEYLESEEILPAEDFLKACGERYDYDFLLSVPDRDNRLEGYLFPDTYFISPDSDAEDIINKMLMRFEEIYTQEYTDRATELGLTMDEVVTIASIIEKEIRVDEERSLAAQVIYNRLDIDMNLQMCSTILYVLEKRKDRLLDDDLNVESPYNTYIYTGLPIGPISNPGKACIEAALYPEEGDYLYFVVRDESTGEHFFTGDYDRFVQAKAEYNQKY